MNELNPLVSVAIVSYNQKDFLRECIESVLVQDYSNIEIVIADDASTDGTPELLLEYREKFDNKFVLLFGEKNQGITLNHNCAHFACNGKYIAWMGGDDLMYPGKLKKQVAFLEQHSDCSIVYHNVEVFDSSTRKKLYYFNERIKYEGSAKVLIKHGTFNCGCSTMVRRFFTPKNGFDVRIPVASDYLYWAETLINGGNICYIDEVLGGYRRHASNVTSGSNKLENYQDHLNSCMIILLRYPKYRKEVFYYISELFFYLGWVRIKPQYQGWLITSLYFNVKIKTLVLLIVNFIFKRYAPKYCDYIKKIYYKIRRII